MHFVPRYPLFFDYTLLPSAIAFASGSFLRWTCYQDAFSVGVLRTTRISFKGLLSLPLLSHADFRGIGIFPPKEPFLYLEERAIQEAQFEDCRGRGEAAHSCSHSSSESLRAAS